MEQREAIRTERHVRVCTYVASVFVCSSVSSSCWGRPWMETPPWLCPDWTLWMNSVSWSEWGRDGPARPERQTWRCSPPPHTAGTHTIHSQLTWCRAISGWLKLHVVQVVSRYSDSWLTGLLCVRVHLEWLVPAVGQHVPLQPALTGGWCVVHLAAFPQTHKHLCGIHTSTHSDYKVNTHKRTQTVVAVMRSLRWPEYKMIPFPWQLGQGKRLLKDMKAFRIIQLKKKQKKNQYRTDGHHFIISHIKNA